MTEDRRKQLNINRLSFLVPELLAAIKLILSELESEGLRPLITCGFRSEKEQDYLYSLGRSRAGKIVTFAKGGQSKHTKGKAVDFAFLDSKGEIDWKIKNFKRLGFVAKKHGLKWGGDWTKFKDNPHVEI